VIPNEREFALHFGYLEERVNKAIEIVQGKYLFELKTLTEMIDALTPEERSRQMEKIDLLKERLKKLTAV
jgi:hypothetical protein